MHDARPKALVLGVNGQDGSYLAQHLADAGWSVHGVGRQAALRWGQPHSNLIYHSVDLSDADVLWQTLDGVRPDAVFHFAAIHGSAGFSYEEHWRDVHAVNLVAAHAVLEYQRVLRPDSRFVYASSSKVFGDSLPALVSEACPRYSQCIYTTTKNAATDLIVYYRKRHAAKASVVWTFNHESPRRGSSYFLPKVVDALAKALIDPSHVAEIATLGFWGDWGDANEYMHLIAHLPEASVGQDLVFATGCTTWASDFVDELFSGFGLDWRKHLVEKFPHEGERPVSWKVDTSRLQSLCNGGPRRSVLEIALDMLRENYPQVWLAHAKSAF